MDVLFIDDDHAVNRYHEIILDESAKRSKLVLHFFTSPMEAINLLHSTDASTYPKLIFLDINMPKMNGWEFVETYQMKNLNDKTAIVILTTSKNPNYKEKASKLNLVKEFATKPLNETFFTNLIKKYCP